MIDLMPDADDTELESAARSFLEASLPGPRLTALAAGDEPFDRPLLRRCGELGWFGLTLDEALGGAGLSVAQECLVFRQIGRYLLPGPVLATTLAALAASAAGETALAGRLASAEVLAGLAEVVPGADRLAVWDPGAVDLLLVADPAAGALRLVEAAEVTGETVATIDPLTHLRWVAPTSLPDPVCVAGDAATLLRHGVLLTSAMLTGIAERVRDASAAYAKVRVQFGRPIGAFQAVKHRCADMAMRAEAAWAQTEVAALRFAGHGAGAAFDVAAAKVVAGDAAIRSARDNIQNHGGIGFTAEHTAHLYLKRAHVLEQQLGATRAHLRTVLTEPIGW